MSISNGSRELDAKKTQEYTEVYNLYFYLVYSIVYSKVNNIHEAEDISQEVFIRLYDKFDEVEHPRKWLYGTLRLVVLEYYKRKKNKDFGDEQLLDTISLSFVNGMRDVRILIEEIMSEMDDSENERDKVVFDMITVHNFTYKQVCQEFNLTMKQVRTIVANMTRKLIYYLNKRGIKRLEDLL